MNGSVKNLPNFFIVGAPKTASTSLFHYLNKHQSIFLPVQKEPEFFLDDSKYEKGLDYYSKNYFKGADKYPAIGDASVNYLISGKVAERISNLPLAADLSFIVLLRNPVDRAYSAFWHAYRVGLEEDGTTFRDAFYSERKRIVQFKGEKKEWWKIAHFQHGKYARNLKKYFKYFDRSQFIFFLLEDFKQPGAVINKMCDFLKVEGMTVSSSYKKYNTSSMPRNKSLTKLLYRENIFRSFSRFVFSSSFRKFLRDSIGKIGLKSFNYPPMDMETRKILTDYYREDIKELAQIIGRDISSWLEY